MICSLIYCPALRVVLCCPVFLHVNEEQHICNDLHLSEPAFVFCCSCRGLLSEQQRSPAGIPEPLCQDACRAGTPVNGTAQGGTRAGTPPELPLTCEWHRVAPGACPHFTQSRPGG